MQYNSILVATKMCTAKPTHEGKPYNFIESKVKMPYFLSIIGKNQYMLTKVREKYHNSIAKMTANGFSIYHK